MRLAKTGFAALIVLTAALLGATLFVSCSGPDENAGLKVLNRGLGTDPESLDPQRSRSTQASTVLRDTGEGLLGHTPDGQVVPAAAESWTVSDDGLVYTFTIRDTARWSDGEKLTAGHFVDGLRRLVEPQTAAFYAQTTAGPIHNAMAIVNGDLGSEELGVAAPDDRTLVITLDRPAPYIVSLLTHPSTFPARLDLDADAQSGAPGAFNGAYAVDRREVNSYIRLVRNPYHWDNANTDIDVVVYHIVTEEVAELNRYRAGELDITASVPPAQFDAVRTEFGDELRTADYAGVYYYGYNLTKPPFKDNPALRAALSLAIDRDVIVERLTGRGEKPAYGWVPPGISNYDAPRPGYAELSQDERNSLARRLFVEAGYAIDTPLEITLHYNTSDIQKRIAVAIQAMWRDVLGVEATLINLEFRALLELINRREETQVFRLSWIGDYDDAQSFLDVMQADNPSNLPGYASTTYDSLMQRAINQPDPDRRRLFLEEAERVLQADHAVVPIYFYISKHLVRSTVQGWQDNLLDYHYSRQLSLSAAD